MLPRNLAIQLFVLLFVAFSACKSLPQLNSNSNIEAAKSGQSKADERPKIESDQVVAKFHSDLDPRWPVYRRAMLEGALQFQAFYSNSDLYFLARDAEYMYDMLRLMNPRSKTIHLLNVSRLNMRDEAVGEYLKQEGIDTESLMEANGKEKVLIDTGFVGTIPNAIKKRFPHYAQRKIKTHLICSDTSVYPSSYTVMSVLEPRAWTHVASQLHDPIVDMEYLPHYQNRSNSFIKRGKRLVPQPQVDDRLDGGGGNPEEALKYMEDLKAYIQSDEGKQFVENRKTFWEDLLTALRMSSKDFERAVEKEYAKAKTPLDFAFLHAALKDLGAFAYDTFNINSAWALFATMTERYADRTLIFKDLSGQLRLLAENKKYDVMKEYVIASPDVAEAFFSGLEDFTYGLAAKNFESLLNIALEAASQTENLAGYAARSSFFSFSERLHRPLVAAIIKAATSRHSPYIVESLVNYVLANSNYQNKYKGEVSLVVDEVIKNWGVYKDETIMGDILRRLISTGTEILEGPLEKIIDWNVGENLDLSYFRECVRHTDRIGNEMLRSKLFKQLTKAAISAPEEINRRALQALLNSSSLHSGNLNKSIRMQSIQNILTEAQSIIDFDKGKEFLDDSLERFTSDTRSENYQVKRMFGVAPRDVLVTVGEKHLTFDRELFISYGIRHIFLKDNKGGRYQLFLSSVRDQSLAPADIKSRIDSLKDLSSKGVPVVDPVFVGEDYYILPQHKINLVDLMLSSTEISNLHSKALTAFFQKLVNSGVALNLLSPEQIVFMNREWKIQGPISGSPLNDTQSLMDHYDRLVRRGLAVPRESHQGANGSVTGGHFNYGLCHILLDHLPNASN